MEKLFRRFAGILHNNGGPNGDVEYLSRTLDADTLKFLRFYASAHVQGDRMEDAPPLGNQTSFSPDGYGLHVSDDGTPSGNPVLVRASRFETIAVGSKLFQNRMSLHQAHGIAAHVTNVTRDRFGMDYKTGIRDVAPHNVPFGSGRADALTHEEIQEALDLVHDYHMGVARHNFRRKTLAERLKEPLASAYAPEEE